MKLATALLFTAAMIGMSIAHNQPTVSWICSLSPDVVATKCLEYGTLPKIPEMVCRDPWREWERICRGRGEVFAKTQFGQDEICRRYGQNLQELAQRACQELAEEYCGLPPSEVYKELCRRGPTYAKVQQPDLPVHVRELCYSEVPTDVLQQYICHINRFYCRKPLAIVCPNRPSMNFAKFQQPYPIQGIQVFLRIFDLCRSVSEQPETNIDQKVEDLCNAVPQMAAPTGGVPPPLVAKVKESIATLCYPTATDDAEVVRTECDELKNLPFPPSLRDVICNRQPDLPICNLGGLPSLREKICILHPNLPFCNGWETTTTTPPIP